MIFWQRGMIMNQTQLTVSKQDAYELNRLYQFYQYFTDKGGGKQAGKIKDLIRKVINREKIVAFCGHFSAGKSTMVNHLIGEQVFQQVRFRQVQI